MNIIFFQNCVSPHQMTYIKELPKNKLVENVVFVAPRVMYSDRENMGWTMKMLGLENTGIDVHICPDMGTVRSIYERYSGKDTYCLYSGINDFKELVPWMTMGLDYSVKRGIITERPNIYWNKPLWLHKLRFMLRTQKYVKHFDYVFGIGDSALDYYSTFSKRWKLIPWGYCTDCRNVVAENVEGMLKAVFVGTVNKNKNVISVLKCMAEKNIPMTFDIIGDGPEKESMEKYVAEHNLTARVVFHGYCDMAEVYARLSKYDMLVLPSRYDGWGAVINEGLQHGLYIVCSECCGASSLLTDNQLGRVFKGQTDLVDILSTCAAEVDRIRDTKKRRVEWSECISGKVMADYMVANLSADATLPALWTKSF